MSTLPPAERADDPRTGRLDEIQEPPATLSQAFGQIGPGLILAAAIVGTGELIATTHAGAKAGFVILWLVIISCFIKVFVQVELGRYAVSSGRTTFSGFRSLPGPGPLLVWWCALMLLVTQLQIGAMIAGIGQAATLILPNATVTLADVFGLQENPELVWGVVVTFLTVAMLWTGSYRLVERTMTGFVAAFTLMTVLCVVLLPSDVAIRWDQLAEGLSFRIPNDRTVIMAALAMFGITGVGATELLSYPYWCMEKGYARSTGPREDSAAWVARARGWMKVMQLDAWVSMVIYTIATVAFFLLGAAVLHGQTEAGGLPDRVDEMINTLVRMYEPTLGPRAAKWFLVLGAIAVLYSTLFAATAGTGRLLADFLRVCGYYPSDSEEYRRKWVRFFCVALPIFGLLLYMGLGSPVRMVTIGGLMQAITLPFIASAAVFLRYKRIDPKVTSNRVWDIMLWISMIGLVGAGVYLGASQLGLI